MNSRTIISVSIFILLFIAPYWLYLPALGLSLIYFRFYWEGIMLAFLIDTLYGYDIFGKFYLRFPVALLACILLLLVPVIQRRLRFNA
jgi:hypothetical protein